jgi:SAM-dependent methyltransferase
MPFGTSKTIQRRLRDVSFVRYFAGDGIDVGCGDDPITKWRELFPLMGKVIEWDKKHGDAQALPGIAPESLDWLHSSHCLEHLNDPTQALFWWCQVVRPGGHIVVLVPDEDLYEQGSWPSRFNCDHKYTFTLSKSKGASWSPVSINIFDLLEAVNHLAKPLRVELLEGTWLPGQAGTDQTLNPCTESSIEFVLRRR